MSLDWNALNLVLALDREGSLSAAARRLGINHATASRQLARAEAQLELRVFDRMPTGLVATEAGRAIVEHAARMEEEATALDLKLAAQPERQTAPLAVTIPPLLADDAFARDLQDFTARHPEVRFRILGENRVFNLHKREADIAIRVTDQPSDSLWGRKMTAQKSTFYASPDFVKNQQQAIEGYVPLPLISFTVWTDEVMAKIADVFPNIEVTMSCDDMPTATALAREGVGMIRAPLFVGDAAGLVPVPGAPVTDYPPIWVLTVPELRTAPRVVAFMRFIADRFRARRATYLGDMS